LPIIKEDESTDYINANYISGLTVDGEHAYIATQGPLPYTIEDFWRMVLAEKCKVVVMLTQFVEAEKQKCAVYFLDEGALTNEELKFNSFSIKVLSTVYDEARQIKKRSILIDEKTTKTVITHFQYLGWPDLGIPNDPSSFDEILKMANESNTERAPMVVHCSAGVGRTGTFIAVNNAINYVEHQRKNGNSDPEVNVPDIIKEMRSERTEMVQTVEQFEFVYLAISKFDFNKKSTPLTNSKKTIAPPSKLEKTSPSKVTIETFPLEPSQIIPRPPTSEKPRPPLNKSQIVPPKPKEEETPKPQRMTEFFENLQDQINESHDGLDDSVREETIKLKRRMEEEQKKKEEEQQKKKEEQQPPPVRMTAFWDDLDSQLNNINEMLDV